MRYVIIFVIVATAVMTFIFADHFPGFLAHYPRLQEANWTVRAWMGMDSPHSSRLTEKKLQETDQILRQASPTKGEVTEKDLEEYRE